MHEEQPFSYKVRGGMKQSVVKVDVLVWVEESVTAVRLWFRASALGENGA